MYLVSLSLPHNAASVLELSRSLEFEHEVRRSVTSQVMGRFGQVDDADERWKMEVEKVVRQLGVGILRQYKDGFSERFFFPASFLV
jgi:sister chromatid cohesion protein DCC1